MNVSYVKVEQKVPWLPAYCREVHLRPKQTKKKQSRFFTRHSQFSPSIYHRLCSTVEICKICHILPSLSSANKDRFPQLLGLLWTQHSSWLILLPFLCLISEVLRRCKTCMAKSETLWHLGLWCSLEDLILTLKLMYLWITWPFIASFTSQLLTALRKEARIDVLNELVQTCSRLFELLD